MKLKNFSTNHFNQILILAIIVVCAILFFSCEQKNETTEKKAPTEETKSFIPEKEFGWYRGVIPEYTMTIGNVKMGKSLFYISLNDYSWTVLHSTKGMSFIGSGSADYEKGCTKETGNLFGELKSDRGETSSYTIRYEKQSDGKFTFTLVGSAGQPDVTLEKLTGEVSTDSFLKDFTNTILN